MARAAARTGTTPPPSTPPVIVENERLIRRAQVQDTSVIPVRTIITVEVGDTVVRDVQGAIIQISDIYATGKHPTYVLPVRHGRLTTDIVFEEGVEEMVRKLCEVVDGKIRLKDGWREVDVMRCSL